MKTEKKEQWTDKVVRGQECIVPEFGLGRVMDFGHEEHTGGFDYIAVKFYAETHTPAGLYRRFAPEAVNLIDPTGLILTPYKAREAKKPLRGHSQQRKTSTPQSYAFYRTGVRKGGMGPSDGI